MPKNQDYRHCREKECSLCEEHVLLGVDCFWGVTEGTDAKPERFGKGDTCHYELLKEQKETTPHNYT